MENQERLYSIISDMKKELTMIVGTVMGGGIELPQGIIDRYAHILGARIEYHQAILPQEIFELLSDILKLHQISELSEVRLNRIKSIRRKFYTHYSLGQSKLIQHEAHAENISTSIGMNNMPIGQQVSEFHIQRNPHNPALNRFFNNNFRPLLHAESRVIPETNYRHFPQAYGPLINKKSKSRRRTKSANHKSKSKTPKRRSA